MNCASRNGSGVWSFSQNFKLQKNPKVFALRRCCFILCPHFFNFLKSQAVHQKDFKKMHVEWWMSWDEPLQPPVQVGTETCNCFFSVLPLPHRQLWILESAAFYASSGDMNVPQRGPHWLPLQGEALLSVISRPMRKLGKTQPIF